VDLWPSRRLEVINDLAGPVVRRHPEIGLLRARLRESGAVVAEMTGSGSTVFGLFASLEGARRGAAAAARTDAWALVTRFAARRPA
jgi:4-diphosphocytidyl-2-C-methyl-D-erythritol kinase